MGTTKVAGIDGFRSAWVAVVLADGRFDRALIAPTFGAVRQAVDDAVVLGVDMPIGLIPEGLRECDREARRLLGARGSTVFAVAPRPVVEMDDYDAACRLCLELTGKKISKQSFHLHRKIREIDEHATDERIYEVHPELVFQRLAGGPLPRKKSWNGVRARMDLLETAGISIPADLGEAGNAAPDDVLDASACAVAAARIGRGEGHATPSPPTQRDEVLGRFIQIWS